jgi:hypothetical protein
LPSEEPDRYRAVEAGDMKIWVREDMVFEDDVPRIAVFPRRNGVKDVGASNLRDYVRQ